MHLDQGLFLKFSFDLNQHLIPHYIIHYNQGYAKLYFVNIFKNAFKNFLGTICIVLKNNNQGPNKTADGTRKQVTFILTNDVFLMQLREKPEMAILLLINQLDATSTSYLYF